jgi:hypothetical protein
MESGVCATNKEDVELTRMPLSSLTAQQGSLRIRRLWHMLMPKAQPAFPDYTPPRAAKVNSDNPAVRH